MRRLLRPHRDNRAMTEYRGSHEAPQLGDGSPLWNLTLGGAYPDDVYGPQGGRLYGSGDDKFDARAYSVILAFRNKPNGFIAVYRAVPKNATGGIQAGDWVTPLREYAKEHGENELKQYKILRKLVRPRDLFTNGNSWCEWGYDPQPPVPYVAYKSRAATPAPLPAPAPEDDESPSPRP
jgi:hypothetical protein